MPATFTYRFHSRAVEGSTPDGAHWITMGDSDYGEGRKVLLDKDGTILGGDLPKAIQGSKIGDLRQSFHDLNNSDDTKKSGGKRDDSSSREKSDMSRTKINRNSDGRKVGPAIIKMSSISAAPERFQYKYENIDASTGVSDKYSDTKFDPKIVGTIYVWHDKEDGKDYVVNGHHRYQMAKRADWDGDVNVEYIDEATEKKARAFGAVVNISEERGTSLDAAKFMRDMELSGEAGIAYLRERNVSLKGEKASDAVSLSNLSDNVFREVAYGRLELSHAKAIGEELAVQPGDSDATRDAIWAAQNGILKTIRSKHGRLSAKIVKELALISSLSPRITKSNQKSLFGSDSEEEILSLDRAKVQSAVRDALTNDVRGFGAVAKSDREDLLRSSGVGDVDSKVAGQKRDEAEGLRDMFDREIRYRGDLGSQLNKILNDAAKEQHNAKGKETTAIRRRAIAACRELLEAAGETEQRRTRPDVRESRQVYRCGQRQVGEGRVKFVYRYAG